MMFTVSQGNWPRESNGSTINEVMRKYTRKAKKEGSRYGKREIVTLQ